MILRRFALNALLLVLACGPRATSSEAASTQRPRPNTATRPEAPPSLAARCESPAIDVRWLGTDETTCPMDGGTELDDLPDGTVTVSVDPREIVAAPGATATADYVLRNASSEPVELALPAFCALASARYDITDADGVSVDRTPCGIGGGGCAGPPRVVTLHPGGDARVRFSVPAHRRVWDGCREQDPEPLEPGRYRLTLDLSGMLGSATASFTVAPPREPPRI